MSLLTLFAVLACAAPPEDDALPLTLSESVRDVDEAETAYWSAALTPPQAARKGAAGPFIDFARLEVTPSIGIAQYSADFEASMGVVGAVQFRVPVPGFPGKRFGVFAELFYSTIDREDLPFYYVETSGSLFGFGLGADFEFVYSQGFFLRGQVGYTQVIFQDVVDVDDGGALLAGVSLGLTVNKARSATYSIGYNPQLLYDSEDWILLHLFGLTIAF